MNEETVDSDFLWHRTVELAIPPLEKVDGTPMTCTSLNQAPRCALRALQIGMRTQFKERPQCRLCQRAHVSDGDRDRSDLGSAACAAIRRCLFSIAFA